MVDADDFLVKDAIRRVYMVYKRNPRIDYIYTQHWWCDENLKKRRKGLSSLPHKGKSFASMAANRKHCFSHWRTFRRKLARKATLFPSGLKYAVDKNLGFILEEIGYGGFLDIPFYKYRYYKGNMSLTHAADQKRLWLGLANEHLKKTKFPIRALKE